MEFMKRNNGDGRYDGFINNIQSKRNPKLSHFAQFIRNNHSAANE